MSIVRCFLKITRIKCGHCRLYGRIVTTHRETKLSLIADADEAILDKGKLTGRIHGVTKALDLIGPRN